MLASYWFATNFHWGALLFLIIPSDIEKMFPKDHAALLGQCLAIGALAALVVPLFAGAVSDRCMHPLGRRRPFIAGGILLNVLGLIGMGLTATYYKQLPFPLILYMGSFVVVQTGNNITSGAYMGLIPDLVEPNQRGAASGYLALMSQAGSLVGVAGIGAVLGTQPVLAKYGAISVVLIAVGLIARFGIKEVPLTDPPPPIHWWTYLKSLWIDPRQFPDFAWVWFTRFLVMCGFYSITPYFKYYLQDVIGINHSEIGSKSAILLGVILIISSVSGVYGGVLSDRIGRKRVVYAANAFISVVAILFIFCRTIDQAFIVGGLFGFGYGAYISVDYALGADVLPNKQEAGKDMAIWHVAMTLPQTVATPLAGLLIGLPGLTTLHLPGESEPVVRYTTQGYAYIFIACALCFGFGAFFLRNVKGSK